MWLVLKKVGFQAQLQIFINTNITVNICGFASWHSYRDGGSVEPQSNKDYINTANGIIGINFSSMYHTKQLNHSHTHQLVVW